MPNITVQWYAGRTDQQKREIVAAITDARNAAAAALLRRVGFRHEAHFLQHVWYKGAWGDEFQFAMLRSEWR